MANLLVTTYPYIGDIKTAKKTYRKMYGKKSVAENWLNNTAPKTAVSRPG